MKIRLGTRGSALALKQADMTEASLAVACPDVEVERVIIKTTGDRRTDVALKDVAATEEIVDKGVFIKELEVALAENKIDFAVHSLKDVPTVLEESFELVSFLERAPVRDALITHEHGGLATLPQGATVATSSVRRARQLLFLRPDLKIVDIRGNVTTRLEKLAGDPNIQGIMLAEAGLLRLGYKINQGFRVAHETLHAECFEQMIFLPAAGQGAVAMEVRKGDTAIVEILQKVNHEPTQIRVAAEREFLRLLDAGCHTPVGVWSILTDGQLNMGARVFNESNLTAMPTHSNAS